VEPGTVQPEDVPLAGWGTLADLWEWIR